MTVEILLIIILILLIINIIITYSIRDKNFKENLSNNLIKIESQLSLNTPILRDELTKLRDENQRQFKENRDEINSSLKNLIDTLTKIISELTTFQKAQFDTFYKKLTDSISLSELKLNNIQEISERNFKDNRLELINSLKLFEEKVEIKLKDIQELTLKRLEEIRVTVDERLQETVEKRFSESFKLISERLEQVHRGLGEMQTIASGVVDLKKILSNIKTRGNLGEIQLENILEQFLSPDQYLKNATVKPNSQERVEFAIKIPSKVNDNEFILLPIDAKFPLEQYYKIIELYDNVTIEKNSLEDALKEFESSIKNNAKTIKNKYINPPITTDFAIMFVPSEGIYAEILKRPGLIETLQRDYKVTVVGPVNLVAFLNSLNMGFKTLAIQKRSSEVWKLLGIIKNDFSKFADLLDKTKKKLLEATNTIEDATSKSRTIEKKLKEIESLPGELNLHNNN